MVRHGKPTFELKGYVRARDLGKKIQAYKQSDITGSPPEDVIQKALTCNIVICSDLSRSLQSAKVLGFSDIHVSDALFREVEMPHFETGSIVFSMDLWSTFLRILSVFGFSRNGESLSMACNRVGLATSRLIALANHHERIMLVGHGFTNYLIVKELISRGWTGPTRPGRRYWEYAVYRFGDFD